MRWCTSACNRCWTISSSSSGRSANERKCWSHVEVPTWNGTKNCRWVFEYCKPLRSCRREADGPDRKGKCFCPLAPESPPWREPLRILKGELGEKSRPDASLGNPHPPLQLLLPPCLVTTCLLLLLYFLLLLFLFFPLFTQKTTCPFHNTSCSRLGAVLGRLWWSYKEVAKGGDCPEDEAKADQSLASFQSFKHPRGCEVPVQALELSSGLSKRWVLTTGTIFKCSSLHQLSHFYILLGPDTILIPHLSQSHNFQN